MIDHGLLSIMTQDEPDQFKKRIDDFTEEMQHLGKKMEHEGRRLSANLGQQGKQLETWFQRTFGVIGPMISSIAGLIVLGIIIWVFDFIGRQTGNSLFTDISYLFLANIIWLFAVSLLISYTEYGNRKSPDTFRWLSPITTAAGLAMVLWIIVNIMLILGSKSNISFLPWIAGFMIANIIAFFFLFLLIGYLLFFSMRATRTISTPQVIQQPEFEQKPQEQRTSEIVSLKRLYRSGKEKILGGVCGGIAEYLSIDPVIIRIIWIFLTLLWGMGIILYIILWIIIPRNQSHKWF
jgi:phage shock protein PspC (stress-responsive transcriptional regulator)